MATPPEYWCGWILAYYQWATGSSFMNIHYNISMGEIRKLYGTLHEATEENFVDTVNAIIRRKTPLPGYSSKEKGVGTLKKNCRKNQVRI